MATNTFSKKLYRYNKLHWGEYYEKAIKYTIRSLLGLLAIVIITLLGYAIYMQENYYRIPDHQVIHIKNNQAKTLATNKTYTLTTYNVGFGAYNPKYSFFMDTGEMKNG